MAILPNDKSWNYELDLSHDARIKTILGLLFCYVWSNLCERHVFSLFWFSFIMVRALTKIKKMNANSNEFWKRMKWIKKRTSRGLLNQNRSSDGRTTKSPSTAMCFSATSWAKSVMICSSFIPTASKSWGDQKKISLNRPISRWIWMMIYMEGFRDLQSKEEKLARSKHAMLQERWSLWSLTKGRKECRKVTWIAS